MLLQGVQEIIQEGQKRIREFWGTVADFSLECSGSGFELEP